MTKNWETPQPASEQMKLFLLHGIPGTWPERFERMEKRQAKQLIEARELIAGMKMSQLESAEKAFRTEQTEEAFNKLCAARTAVLQMEMKMSVPKEKNPLRTMPYQDYLKTEHWQLLRGQALWRAGHRCQICNSSESPQVHHRTYERRGAELPSDLTVLCEECHTIFHENSQLSED